MLGWTASVPPLAAPTGWVTIPNADGSNRTAKLVVTSPAAATTEAVTQGISGLVVPVEAVDDWVSALRRLSADDAFAERLRAAARG